MRIVKEVGFGRQRSEPPRFRRLPTASKYSHLFLPSCLLCFLGFPSAMPDPVAADGDDVDDVLVSFLESEILSGDQVLFFFAMYRIETGSFSKIPPELFHHIFKFLSSEVWWKFSILFQKENPQTQRLKTKRWFSRSWWWWPVLFVTWRCHREPRVAVVDEVSASER
ncbi:hypothetical protein B296_00035858 [Ensete ventricosum]|uniref:F-box domain-containing protein n=1 Tax=Ensete ventricosum TaxID=4639 RepID=A0A426XC69_ENSVE|nr:hypothetical protein B296_00035858 [Ensete ventricosum]